MRVPDTVAEVYVTEQLFERIAAPADHLKEKLAVRDIANQMANKPSQVLPLLVDLAIDLCGAVGGGISLYEERGELFRWHHLRGTLEQFNGATTPRDYSPCGITLDHRSAVLVQRPERVYSWLVEAGVSLPECLLVPLYVGGAEPLGTLWIVSEEVGHFNKGHASALEELAGFTGIALQMIRSEERLTSALERQETLTREMGHRVKNVFAITDGMLRISARAASTKEELVKGLSARLHALAGANALVRPIFNGFGEAQNASNLSEVIAVVLRPYTHAAVKLEGPRIDVGEQATNTIALIFHELATNAAKYGALSREKGAVRVVWNTDGESLNVIWSEAGGPPIKEPPKASGFGTMLVTSTISSYGGTITNSWRHEGVKVNISMPLRSLSH